MGGPSLLHLEPRPCLHFQVRDGSLAIRFQDQVLGAATLSLDSIYSTMAAVDASLLAQGATLDISEKDLRTPLGFETLLHLIMTNVIHCIFPRKHQITPLRHRLELLSMDAETNFIRNAPCVNSLNHLYILKNRLAGRPLVLALPGPSLDFDALRRIRGDVVLMAVGRAAGPLLEAGIIPDFFYMQDINAYAWDRSFGFLGDRRLDSMLIANPLGKIWAYRKNFSRVFKAWNLYPFEKDVFPKLEEIPPSSVSGAYSAARLLGCSPILFVGNDCGANAARPEGAGVESMTNLPFEARGDHIRFAPLGMKKNLFLRFADEFCVTTSLDYVAASQWVKMSARRDAGRGASDVYDASQTRLTQFNSVIQDVSRLEPLQGGAMPPLPAYAAECDPADYLRRKHKAYSFILRQLEKGVLPSSVLKRPYSALLEKTAMASRDQTEPIGADMDKARANAGTLL
ncbi:MAG: 6-hydroxymethylpterin diphosphokinase MptE-like protein, partial [Desulfovibrionaceae bacterium]